MLGLSDRLVKSGESHAPGHSDPGVSAICSQDSVLFIGSLNLLNVSHHYFMICPINPQSYSKVLSGEF